MGWMGEGHRPGGWEIDTDGGDGGGTLTAVIGEGHGRGDGEGTQTGEMREEHRRDDGEGQERVGWGRDRDG